MAESFSEVHNRVAPAILVQIVGSAPDPSNMLAIMESVVLGVVMHAAGRDVRLAEVYLETLSLAVVERLTTWPKS